MPTGTEIARPAAAAPSVSSVAGGSSRRQWLARAVAGLAGTWGVQPHAWALAPGILGERASDEAASVRLAAAWDRDGRHHVGVLGWPRSRGDGAALEVLASLEVPTRAHGLLVEPGGTMLAVARRPGDWLLRFDAQGRALQWHWLDEDDSEPHQLNGHAVHVPGGLLSTETDRERGLGWLALRDARTLALRARWPTGGQDPHQVLLAPDGTLFVANGGIPTQAETGRRKLDLDRMDASLLRIDARHGTELGRWRLPDTRLSIRHLAWGAGVLGIALQAEHDDAAQRAQAPLLALFDGRTLRTAAPAPQPLAGYGGDVAFVEGGLAGPGDAPATDAFVVSATRAGLLACWDREGRWLGSEPLPQAGALAASSLGLCAAGAGQALPLARVDGLAVDNHWQAV